MSSPLRDASAHRKNAFTLVELLIVVTIIALLTAILLPVFSRVRNSVKTSTCQSNLRQIGVAMELYASDYNGKYPNTGSYPVNCTWTYNIAHYVKSDAIFICPMAPNEFYQAGCPPTATVDGIGHHYDGGYIHNIPNSNIYTRTSQIRIRMPAQFILVTEGVSGFGIAQPSDEKGLMSLERLEEMGLTFRHNKGINILFADGHTKWLTADAVRDRKYWSYSGQS